jgi:copper(I)-binding protein
VRLAFVLALAAPLAACAEQPSGPEIGDPWARDTAGGTANAAVFMTIVSPTADRLIAASAPVAGRTDLMTMEMAGGAMTMRYVAAIDLPAGEPVRLDPSGLHVWLDGLSRPLVAGESFPLTLEFERAGRREVTVPVIAPAAPAPGGGMAM